VNDYDNGGTFPPSVQPITNHYNAADAIAAGLYYIRATYGPEQVLKPAGAAPGIQGAVMHPDRLLLFLILNETALITQRLDSIVSDQDQLNADVAEENTLLTTMENEITSLQAQPAAAGLDFSGVNSVLARLEGDAASAAPAPTAPADAGTPAAPGGDVPAAPAGPVSVAVPTGVATPVQPVDPATVVQPASVPNGVTTDPTNPTPTA